MTKFNVPYKDTTLVGDILGPAAKPSVLFLHGAGTADRTRYGELRSLLAEQGISTCAFDFIGHGETGGDLKQSSLRDRTEQALAVIRQLHLPEPLSIFGASMSGYTAIKLSSLLPVSALMLFVPCAYDSRAYEIPFDQGFTNIIRQPASWNNSDAWEILNAYREKLLIVAAEQDKIVPKEVVQRIYDSAQQTDRKELIIIEQSPHHLAQYLSDHPPDLHRVATKMTDLLVS